VDGRDVYDAITKAMKNHNELSDACYHLKHDLIEEKISSRSMDVTLGHPIAYLLKGLLKTKEEPKKFDKATSTIILLLKHGAGINDPHPVSQLTPLFIALDIGNVELIKLLIENGADPGLQLTGNMHNNIPLSEIQTPVMRARATGNNAIIDVITKALNQFTPKIVQRDAESHVREVDATRQERTTLKSETIGINKSVPSTNKKPSNHSRT
jgi:hypothetical protein